MIGRGPVVVACCRLRKTGQQKRIGEKAERKQVGERSARSEHAEDNKLTFVFASSLSIACLLPPPLQRAQEAAHQTRCGGKKLLF